MATKPAKKKQPNILVIFGDDIGYWNLSAYNLGVMGYRTPNIDRLAKEGALFTDYYAQQSCTAGRAAFITGQCPFRTGLTKVGMPGAKVGLQAEDPTIADLLKPLGYRTGQFGKNHLGDRDEYLPTVHGFDEFFGNLYHLNAEEEPENVDYPKDPAFRQRFGPRGVLRSKADGQGGQTVQDTGPLNKKRMETVDEEFLDATLDFIDRTQQEQKPFFIWFNTTRMHIHTHLRKESQGKTGFGLFPDGMVEHDGHVGRLLDKLDQLGIADDTLVVYSTDNGAMTSMWPDGGMTPFRGEKDTNWEGAFRAPCLVRWPGVVKPGTQINELFSSEDWLPTLVAAAGEPDIVRKLLDGHDAGDKHFKVHLDGYEQTALLSGQSRESKREEFFYFGDDGELVAMRYRRFKLVFEEQTARGIEVWAHPFSSRRVPLIIDLRADPLERSMDSVGYSAWMLDRAFVLVPAQALVGRFLATFQEFPSRQHPASFSIDQVMAKMENGAAPVH
ncbi:MULTISPECIES: arylsulfatase [unclassified Corallococcus]|uniref:arylsulfatase n=1 Tax=unclassified Corallococcus TaxID=2685029 RepID=UPI001A8C297A|nr:MULTISPECIES: arylsulfatase [unclassified Corallococcus]MBN9682974.1 arylsulfatase [Corallococcus sp. NCSPR001]WAS85491.1 arylsulfatase [Corallococcus sp. NCRR]